MTAFFKNNPRTFPWSVTGHEAPQVISNARVHPARNSQGLAPEGLGFRDQGSGI